METLIKHCCKLLIILFTISLPASAQQKSQTETRKHAKKELSKDQKLETERRQQEKVGKNSQELGDDNAKYTSTIKPKKRFFRSKKRKEREAKEEGSKQYE